MEVKHTHEINEARKDITFGGVFRLNTGDVFPETRKGTGALRSAMGDAGIEPTHTLHRRALP